MRVVHWWRFGLIVSMAALIIPCSIEAQQTHPLVGRWVRVRATDLPLGYDELVGRLDLLTEENLAVSTWDSGRDVWVPLDHVFSIDVHEGRGDWGLIAGGIFGIGMSLAVLLAPGGTDSTDFGYSLLIGAAGFASGYLIGSTFPRDRWRSVPLRDIRRR